MSKEKKLNQVDSPNNKKSETSVIDKFLQHPYLIIFLLAFVVYFQTLFFEYLYFDDDYFIYREPQRTENLSDFESALTHTYMLSSYYRPVVTMTFFFGSEIGGEDPFMHHFVNLMIHCIGSCVVFALFRRLKYKNSIALTIALIFAVHPILTNSVAWLVGRCDMLAGLFSMAAFIYFIRYMEEGRIKFLVFQSIALLLAIFSKELTLLTPLILGLYWRFNYHGKKHGKKTGNKKRILIISWILPVILFPVMKILLNIPLTDPFFSFSHIFINLQIIPETIAKIILPISIVPLPQFSTFTTMIGIILFFGTIILVTLRKKQFDNKKILFGILLFFILIFPGLFIRLRETVQITDYLDCRDYLPIIGIFIVIIELLPEKVWDLTRKLNLIVILLLVVVLSLISISQSGYYRDQDIFRQSAARFNPGISRGFIKNKPEEIAKLVDEAAKKSEIGDLKGAIEIFSRLIDSDSTNFRYYDTRGFLRIKTQDFKGAMEDFNLIIRMEPEYAPAYYQRAYIRIELQDYSRAIKDLDKVIELEPESFLSYYQRGLAKYHTEDLEGSIEDCSQSIKIKPGFPNAYVQRGLAKLQLEKKRDACRDFQKANELGSLEADQLIREYCR